MRDEARPGEMSAADACFTTWHRPISSLAVALLFAAAYGLAPLFYSNQNQYFVHGFADAGWGRLADDWLAETTDPTPFWTMGVAWVVRNLPLETFLVAQFVLLAVYAWSLLRIAETVFGDRYFWSFSLILVLIHSAVARWLSYRVLGEDYPWYFQCGVAGQYVLGAMFQPSAFGVFLLLAVSESLRGRGILAAVSISVAATIHPTYLLPGATLTLGLMFAELRTGRPVGAIRLGLMALLLVLPVAVHSWQSFAPTDPIKYAQAQHILVETRIPHHAKVDRWLDPIAVMQLVWIATAAVLCRRTPLIRVVLVAFSLGTILTVVQVVMGSDALALLFPWRISTVLVPLSTTVVIARIVRFTISPKLVISALVGLACFGVAVSGGRGAFHIPAEEEGLYQKVRSILTEGHIYALPVRIPDPSKSPRGSSSSDFRPLADKRNKSDVIPIDLQRFRLATGAPIFIDFKSIPYRDFEVINWLDRLREVERIYGWLEAGKIDIAMGELSKNTVTHLVWPRNRTLKDPRLILVYEDDFYQLFEVIPDR